MPAESRAFPRVPPISAGGGYITTDKWLWWLVRPGNLPPVQLEPLLRRAAWNIGELSALLGIGTRTLTRLIERSTGLSAKIWLRQTRAVIHLHNTRQRRSLDGLTPAQAYFHHRPRPWSRARRHEIFDWIRAHARTIVETKWEMADHHARAAAWRRSVAAWLRCQHLITVSPKPQPSPLFKTQIRS